MRELVSVDHDSWKADIDNIKEFYNLIGDRVPAEMWDELAALEKRLG
ncbi:MAG: phosphoenolpyruvate carboxykinase (GTP) [Clostridia bacterium]|nr:phosphoenolpyruvate carboxykinase (GTP) [Clostridia bacterium]